MLTLLSFACLSTGLLASAGIQITVDATKQLAAFRGSDSPGHSTGMPVRLELVVKGGELSPDGTIHC